MSDVGKYEGRWCTREFLEGVDERFVQHGEGLVRFTWGQDWATYPIVDYDLGRDCYRLGKMAANNLGTE